MPRAWFGVFIGLALLATLAANLFARRPAGAALGAGAPALPGTLTRSAGPSSYNIDRLTAGTRRMNLPEGGSAHVRISAGQSLSLDGWAADDPHRSAAGGVLVQIDDADRVAASYGGARPDVAAGLHLPLAAGSGFHAVVPAALLPAGRHSLSLLVLTADRRHFYWYPNRVVVEVGAETVAQPLGASTLVIDEIAAGAGPPVNATGGRLRTALGQDLTLDGWATVTAERGAAERLAVQVDGAKPIPALYGLPRPDVATGLRWPAALDSGFRATVPTSALPAGTHRISFLVYAADRRWYYWYPDRLEVDVPP